MGIVFLPSVCDGFCVSVFSLGQGSRRFCHELYGQSTVMFCRSGRDACFWKLFVFFVPTMFSGILGSFVKNSTVVSPLFGLHANILEKYVLLSALLHDQSRLQSSSCFQHQFVWLPFSRTLVCKGGQQLFVLSCTWEHEIRVFEPELRCCVTLA